MLGYLEYIAQYCNIPIGFIIVIIVFFAISNLIGEILEFKGKVVPEFIKFRKYFARKKQERETLAKMPNMMSNVERLLNDVDQHYSKDNIALRDGWMREVNESMKEFKDIKGIVIDIAIDSKRNKIIDFANRASDINIPVTREEFNQVFKIYDEYEKIIEENGRTNGEVEISYRMINEAYEERTKTHSFVEDKRGYNV